MSVSSSVFEITLLIIKVTKNSSYLVSTYYVPATVPSKRFTVKPQTM